MCMRVCKQDWPSIEDISLKMPAFWSSDPDYRPLKPNPTPTWAWGKGTIGDGGVRSLRSSHTLSSPLSRKQACSFTPKQHIDIVYDDEYWYWYRYAHQYQYSSSYTISCKQSHHVIASMKPLETAFERMRLRFSLKCSFWGLHAIALKPQSPSKRSFRPSAWRTFWGWLGFKSLGTWDLKQCAPTHMYTHASNRTWFPNPAWYLTKRSLVGIMGCLRKQDLLLHVCTCVWVHTVWGLIVLRTGYVHVSKLTCTPTCTHIRACVHVHAHARMHMQVNNRAVGVIAPYFGV